MVESQKNRGSKCIVIRESLSAKTDNEQQTVADVEVEQHLFHCSECTEFQAGLMVLNQRLSKELTVECDSEALWKRIMLSIDSTETETEKPSNPGAISAVSSDRYATVAKRKREVISIGLAACLLFGVVFSAMKALNSTDIQKTALEQHLVVETVRDFETFRVRGFKLDVHTRDSDEIMSWISEKIDFDLPDEVVPPTQFKMAGGRLCSFLNRRLAFFHYEKNDRVLAFYVMRAAGLRIPNGGDMLAQYTEGGLTAVTWKRDELAYVIVSDLPVDDIMLFANRS